VGQNVDCSDNAFSSLGWRSLTSFCNREFRRPSRTSDLVPSRLSFFQATTIRTRPIRSFMAVALVPSPPSPPSTESQQKLELDEFLRDYANGSFPMDRPPDRPKKLQVKTTLANSHYPSSSSSTTPTMAPSLPLPIHEYEDFSSYVEDFWNANRALPQIPSTNDVKREKVIRRCVL